jgi:uncharacterized SAM-binding protein YcdF (DUF218 family)
MAWSDQLETLTGGLFKAFYRIVYFLIFLWLGGLLQYIDSLPETDVSVAMVADGVVVFTGGANRLDKAADILATSRARKMLISGVDTATTEQDLAALLSAKITPSLFACCIELGYRARDTFGNAVETANWANRHGLDSFFLVTANYHMPRSLLLTRNALPDQIIYPLAVASGKVVLDSWWQRPGTARLLAVEYSKYIIVLLRVMVLRPLVSFVNGQLN